jgi:tetratricopeptide (TPR) repeat protein
MPEPKVKKSLNKRQIQALGGGIVVVLVLVLLVFSYPWLQLKLAEQLIEAGKYAQAEPILSSLMASKPQWTEAGYKLVACQLSQGKGREAAQTVLSLTDTQEIDDLELAIVFMDVAKHLLNTGAGEAALELAKRVGAQSEGEMLETAIKEVGFLIANYSDLPLALDAVNLALSQGGNNWLTNQKAFNLLLTKALESSPLLGEPALDRALQLYPNNIIAVTRKASIIGDKNGPKEALEFLIQKEIDLEDSIIPEYLAVKRTLLIRLAGADPKADLNQFTKGMPQDMIVEIAKQGVNHAWLHMKSGRQYYHLAPDEPQVAYQFGRNLIQMHLWETARDIFRHLEEIDPKFMNFQAVYAALDSKTKTDTTKFASGEILDAIQISPDGKWLAWRKWLEHPWEQVMVSDLILTNLSASGSNPQSLGDAILFKWSPDSNYLALQSMTSTGLGRLHIITVQDGSRYTLPPEYDIIDFNWANNDLMIQAQREHQILLLHLAPPKWKIENELAWQLNSNVNQDFSWLTIKGNTLIVYRNQQKYRTFDFKNNLVSFTGWSPNGNLVVIEDTMGKSWIYNHQKGNIAPIEIQGQFAAWGGDQDIFWFLPLWDQLHVLVGLNSKGSIQKYYPYSLDNLYYDISIAADGETLALMEDHKILIMQK